MIMAVLFPAASIRWMFPALLAVTLAGCGGQSDIRTATPARESANPDERTGREAVVRDQSFDTRPVIAAFGDSLSAGFGVEPGKSYPDDLQRLLDAAGYKYRVANLGVSGDTTTDGVERLPALLAAHPA